MRKKNKPFKELGLITEINPLSTISEQYRTISTNIAFLLMDQGLKTVVITSVEAGSGKSTTASNLAITYAKQGYKVMLMDTDLRRPNVHVKFGLQNSAGLTNVLTRQVELGSAIQIFQAEQNLHILTAGTLPPNPFELLNSQAMKAVVTSVSRYYDLILLDTSPVGNLADARALGRLADGIVLVTRVNQTKKADLAQTVKSLKQIDSHIIGVIVNGASRSDSSYDYYYY